ncbi:MAG: hypothetical protein JST81_01965 [Bacteroidetes bacterium]|nr:hypothetical protein [Bacteroidota bacterium]
MKRIILSILVILGISFSSFAQDSTAVKKQELRKMKGNLKEGKQARKEKMKDLNLSEDQKKEIMANREEMRAKTNAIRNDQSLSEEEKNKKIEALRKEQREKRKEVLTADQKQKLAENKVQQKADKKAKAEQRLADMKVKLSLTDDQVNKLRSQEQATHAKMRAIEKDQTLAPAAKKEKMRELRTHAEEERKKILSAEQMKKWEEMRKNEPMPGPKRHPKAA